MTFLILSRESNFFGSLALPWVNPRIFGHPSMESVTAKPSLGVQSGHAPCSSRGDRLTVIAIGDVARREDPVDAGIRAEWLGINDVAFVIGLHLSREKIGVWCMSDGAEHPSRLDHFRR